MISGSDKPQTTCNFTFHGDGYNGKLECTNSKETVLPKMNML